MLSTSTAHEDMGVFARMRSSISFLEDHNGVSKRAVGVASPHRPEALQESKAISAQTEGESPDARVLHE